MPYRRSGKLVVAVGDKEVAELGALKLNAEANGVTDLLLIDGNEVRAREPHVRAEAALFSPGTGIVEAEALVRALTAACRDLDVPLLPVSGLVDAAAVGNSMELVTPHERIHARQVVNAAGLDADDVAALLGGSASRSIRTAASTPTSHRRRDTW